MMRLSKFNNRDFDRGAGRFKEALWWVIRLLFFLHPIPLPSSIKVAWLRIFGAEIGSGVVIRSSVNITFPWRLALGNHVWIGDECLLLTLAPIRIADDVCISQRSFLCTGSHDHRSQGFDLITEPISIGSGCWIAASAFVAPGVTIGSGSVIGAGAVVTRNVPDRNLAVGNPAVLRPIGESPSPQQPSKSCESS